MRYIQDTNQPHNHVNIVTTEMVYNILSLAGAAFNIPSHMSVQYKMKLSHQDYSLVFFFLWEIHPTRKDLK